MKASAIPPLLIIPGRAGVGFWGGVVTRGGGYSLPKVNGNGTYYEWYRCVSKKTDKAQASRRGEDWIYVVAWSGSTG